MRLLLLGLALASPACVPAAGGWSAATLAAGGHALPRGHRLVDGPAHPLPHAGGVDLVLCRWRRDAAIPVRFGEEISSPDRSLLREALRAWTAAGLGIAFDERPAGEALPRWPESDTPRGIELHFADRAGLAPAPRGGGDTVADCGARELRFASIYLNRDHPNPLERDKRALSRAELLGNALHELGHALGFAGHVRTGRSILSGDPAHARSAAERWLRGEAIHEPVLEALYRLPSGVLVGRLELSEGAAAQLAALAAAARAAGWRGPFSRAGGSRASWLYRSRGRVASLVFEPWPWPDADVPIPSVWPNAQARGLLDR